ncbi:hypothetical protein H2204_014113 [Knufia peltigerae]|uniref:Uncharacterized protein n=1 Tax=Knufia peltigerae TaxID=1002370 RepID=A0AA38XMA7_9EURO|nr:hypothetical protein H2204_014113 [Knufia peltigerae]
MRFSTVRTLALLGLGLSSASSAYVIHGYSNNDCGGDGTEINVWDNTCATWFPAFGSFKVVAYGSGGQIVRFHTANNCGGPILVGNWYADGSDGDFQVSDTCHNLGEGHNANAAGSFAV